MTHLAFVDTETTGLDPDRHQVWEVGLILRDDVGFDTEYLWQLPVDEGAADPAALTVGDYYTRRWHDASSDDFTDQALGGQASYHGLRTAHIVPADLMGDWAHIFAELTHGAHLVGAVPAFDDAFLRRLLRTNGACPGWHYHLIDVEALAAGQLGRYGGRPPWRSNDLSQAVGVNPDDYDRHTALGDARWARAIYNTVLGRKHTTTADDDETEEHGQAEPA